jgi:acetyltransferase-like isoleucine patch superfamily enzyme
MRFTSPLFMEKVRASFYRGIGIQVGNNLRISAGAILDIWDKTTPGGFGDNVAIGENCVVSGGVYLGSNVAINNNVSIIASKPTIITISDECLIAQNVVIRADDHNFDDINVPINKQGHKGKNVQIGRDCWIGANAVVLKGVVLGDHCIVGAGSVVTKCFPAYSIIAGNPAKLIRSRKD